MSQERDTSGERWARLQADLRVRRERLPRELARIEERGRSASQELLQAAPDAVEPLKLANRFLYSLAKRKGELDLLDELLQFLEHPDDPSLPAAGTDTVLEAQEEERRRTSIRIHDGPAQTMANIMMRLEFCEKLATKDGIKAAREIGDVRKELDAVLQEVRRLIFDLRPMTLDDLGLLPTLQRFVENEKERVPFSLQLIVRGPNRRFLPLFETHLYRIIQEGLRNAQEHAKPAEFHIRFRIEAEEVRITLEDDGVGFDVEATNPGTGMAEIRRRVRAMGGEVRWDSRPGQGCRLEVTVPIRGKES